MRQAAHCRSFCGVCASWQQQHQQQPVSLCPCFVSTPYCRDLQHTCSDRQHNALGQLARGLLWLHKCCSSRMAVCRALLCCAVFCADACCCARRKARELNGHPALQGMKRVSAHRRRDTGKTARACSLYCAADCTLQTQQVGSCATVTGPPMGGNLNAEC